MSNTATRALELFIDAKHKQADTLWPNINANSLPNIDSQWRRNQSGK